MATPPPYSAERERGWPAGALRIGEAAIGGIAVAANPSAPQRKSTGRLAISTRTPAGGTIMPLPSTAVALRRETPDRHPVRPARSRCQSRSRSPRGNRHASPPPPEQIGRSKAGLGKRGRSKLPAPVTELVAMQPVPQRDRARHRPRRQAFRNNRRLLRGAPAPSPRRPGQHLHATKTVPIIWQMTWHTILLPRSKRGSISPSPSPAARWRSASAYRRRDYPHRQPPSPEPPRRSPTLGLSRDATAQRRDLKTTLTSRGPESAPRLGAAGAVGQKRGTAPPDTVRGEGAMLPKDALITAVLPRGAASHSTVARRVFRSTLDLQTATRSYLAETGPTHNRSSRPNPPPTSSINSTASLYSPETR